MTNNKTYKASDLLVAALENEGVEYVFALPGEENLDIVNSLQASKQIKLVVLRHEQGAGFMAANYGRLTSKPGVCLVTLGPGATNVATAVAYARLGSMPMLLLTGQKPMHNSSQGFFQLIDVVRMMGPITKTSDRVTLSDDMPEMVHTAFAVAMNETAGVVHVEIPEDIAQEKVHGAQLFKRKRPTAALPLEKLKVIADLLCAARHPLVLFGMETKRYGVDASCARLIEETGLPFVTTQMGKGAVDERNSAYLGTTALSSGETVHEAIAAADFILSIGHNTTEKPPFITRSEKSILAHLSFGEPHTAHIYEPNHVVFGRLDELLGQLTEEIKKRETRKKWQLQFFETYKRKPITPRLGDSKSVKAPFTMAQIVETVQEAFSVQESIVALDNGLYKLSFARDFIAHHRDHLMLDNALATMGAGLPTAMVAKLVYPERNVCAICGDGGFMMNSQEIESAIRLQLDITVLVLRDDAYGMIRWKQKQYGFTDFGMSFSNPDFVEYATAYGAKGYRPHDLHDLNVLLNEVKNKKGVHVIDVPITYSHES